MDTIKEMISDIITCDPEDLSDETTIYGECGLDHADIIEIIMAMEDETGREPSDKEIEKWQTIGDISEFFKGEKE